MRRYVLQALALFFTAAIWIGCDKKDNNNDNNQTEDTFKLRGTASGANERPNAVITDGTASLTGTYKTEDKILHYTITWTGLSAPAANMHFHGPASTEEAAGVQVAITDFPQETSGTVTGIATLTADQETQLLGGKWYYNIHTSTHQGGEMRGQVSATHD